MKAVSWVYALALPTCLAMMGMQTASADVSVAYKMSSKDGDAMQTIQYANKQHVRLDMTDVTHHKIALMKLGDKTYMINGKVVQDLDQLASMMAMMGKGARKSHSEHPSIKYEDTGRTETIAGIKGKVYHFTERGKQHEIVLGKDKELEAAVLGVVDIAKALSVVMPADANNLMQQNTPVKGMAMLRLDNRVRLQSIKRGSIPDAAFSLPAEPQQFGAGLGKLLGR